MKKSSLYFQTNIVIIWWKIYPVFRRLSLWSVLILKKISDIIFIRPPKKNSKLLLFKWILQNRAQFTVSIISISITIYNSEHNMLWTDTMSSVLIIIKMINPNRHRDIAWVMFNTPLYLLWRIFGIIELKVEVTLVIDGYQAYVFVLEVWEWACLFMILFGNIIVSFRRKLECSMRTI